MRGFVVSIVLIVVGVVLAAVGGGRVGFEAAGLAVAGIGAVIGVSAAFWIIGRSEDRERGHE
jgi:O-antigen/teichoic acid export membrane protein